MKKKTIKLSEIVRIYNRKMEVGLQITQKMGFNRGGEEMPIVNMNTAKAYIKQYQDEGYEIINDLIAKIESPIKSIEKDNIIDIEAKLKG